MIQFLKKYESKTDYTHLSIIGGKWNIPDSEINNFNKIYAKEVTKRELHIAEKHIPNHGPIVIDFDLRYNTSSNYTKSPLTPTILDLIIKNITNLIATVYDKNAYDLTCILLKRPTLNIDSKNSDIVKDGIHIQFPYIVTPYEFQYALRLKYLAMIAKDLDSIKYTNKIEDIYDISVIERNCWFLFGSTKPKIKPYEIFKVYNSKLDLSKYSAFDKIKLLSIRNKEYVEQDIATYSKFINIYHEETINKKKTKNINIKKIVNSLSDTTETENDVDFGIIIREYTKKYTSDEIRDMLNILNKVRQDSYSEWIKVGFCLFNYGCAIDKKDDMFKIWKEWSKKSKQYTQNCCEKYWRKMTYSDKGYSIASLLYYAKKDNPVEYKNLFAKSIIMDNNEKLHNDQMIIRHIKPLILENYSKYIAILDNKWCPIYKKNHKRPKVYIDIDTGGLVLKCRSLKCLGLTNPLTKILLTDKQKSTLSLNVTLNINTQINNYNVDDNDDIKVLDIDHKIKINDNAILNKLLLSSLNGIVVDICNVFYYLYKDKINCVKNDKNISWYHFIDHKWVINNEIVRNIITNEFRKQYMELKDNKGIENYKKNVMINIANLGSTRFIENMHIELASMYYNDNKDFYKNLDSDNNLICFKNGVYDLNKFEFRNGRPEDYLTLCVGYNYSPEYSNHKVDLDNFLESIQPNAEERIYLLTFLGLCLSTTTPEEVFSIFTGSSRNGKGALQDLLICTFGDYYEAIESTLLTTKKLSSGGPSAELSILKSKRIAIASEPQGDLKINSGFMKLLTGGDPIPYRNLYERTMQKFKPQFKMILLCNDIPEMDKNDEGVWNRCRCISFPTKFVINPTKSNERKIDKDLKRDKIPKWNQDFMLILIEYYKKYKKDGLISTNNINKMTLEYKMDSDIYLTYMAHFFEKSDSHISMNEIYKHFIEWKQSCNNNNIYAHKDIRKEVSKYYDIISSVKTSMGVTSGIKNIKIKYEEDALDLFD